VTRSEIRSPPWDNCRGVRGLGFGAAGNKQVRSSTNAILVRFLKRFNFEISESWKTGGRLFGDQIAVLPGGHHASLRGATSHQNERAKRHSDAHAAPRPLRARYLYNDIRARALDLEN
jgi:hypothetical protein